MKQAKQATAAILTAMLIGMPTMTARSTPPGAGDDRTGEPRRVAGSDIAWAGRGEFRLLVRVEPVELDGRERDELPAQVAVDFSASLRKLRLSQKVDLGSIQVIGYDPATGEPIAGPAH